jgi:hypothetical protein
MQFIEDRRMSEAVVILQQEKVLPDDQQGNRTIMFETSTRCKEMASWVMSAKSREELFSHFWEESKKFINELHEPDYADMIESGILISKSSGIINNA